MTGYRNTPPHQRPTTPRPTGTEHAYRTEWGIAHASNPYKLHRGPMTEAEAYRWIAGWVEDGGRPETFVVLSREVGAWKPMARSAA